MKQKKLRQVICLSAFILLIESLSEASSQSVRATERKGMYLAVVQAGAGMMLDPQQHVRGAAMVAWVPTYHFSPALWARWHLGLNVRNFLAKDSVTVGDIAFTFIEKPKHNSPLFGEIGGGVQYWTKDPSRKFYPEVKAGFGYQFGDGNTFIKSFQLSYNYVFNDPLKTHQLLGVITFGF